MRRIILGIGLLVFAVNALAQQVPLYSLYYKNEFLINPSFAVKVDAPRLDLIYRNQWTGIDGAPVTQGAMFTSPAAEQVGIGINIVNDRAGLINRTGGFFTYAYKIGFGGDHRIAFGLTGGYLNTNIDWASVSVADENDSRINNSLTVAENSASGFDASFGFHYGWKGLELGLAIPHVFETDAEFTDGDASLTYMYRRHYMASLGYEVELGMFDVKPLVTTRLTQDTDPQFDIALMGRYNELIWLAAAFRSDYALSFGVGVDLHDKLSIGYAYDMTTTDIGTFAGPTHEIMVGYRFGQGSYDGGGTEGPVDPKKLRGGKGKNMLFELVQQLREELDSTKQAVSAQGKQIEDHEERIKALEDQIDSLKLEIKTELEQIMNDNSRGGSGSGANNIDGAGSGSYDVRFDDGGEPLDEQKFYDEQGNEIDASKPYEGKIYDEAGNEVSQDDFNEYQETKKAIDQLMAQDGGSGTKGGGSTDGQQGGSGGDLGSTGGQDAQGGSGSKGQGSSGIVNYPVADKDDLAKDDIKFTTPGNYVVVGSFRNKKWAIMYRKALAEKGLNPGIVYNHLRKWFYVYVEENGNYDEIKTKALQLRETDYPDAWIHIIVK